MHNFFPYITCVKRLVKLTSCQYFVKYSSFVLSPRYRSMNFSPKLPTRTHTYLQIIKDYCNLCMNRKSLFVNYTFAGVFFLNLTWLGHPSLSFLLTSLTSAVVTVWLWTICGWNNGSKLCVVLARTRNMRAIASRSGDYDPLQMHKL